MRKGMTPWRWVVLALSSVVVAVGLSTGNVPLAGLGIGTITSQQEGP